MQILRGSSDKVWRPWARPPPKLACSCSTEHTSSRSSVSLPGAIAGASCVQAQQVQQAEQEGIMSRKRPARMISQPLVLSLRTRVEARSREPYILQAERTLPYCTHAVALISSCPQCLNSEFKSVLSSAFSSVCALPAAGGAAASIPWLCHALGRSLLMSDMIRHRDTSTAGKQMALKPIERLPPFSPFSPLLSIVPSPTAFP